VSLEFREKPLQTEDYWRGIVLLGRNVASYKFALAKSLLDLKPAEGDLLKLSDIAPVFSAHIASHLKECDKQATSRSSRFLDYCRQYNLGEITKDELTDFTVRHGFENVIDAFHRVGSDDVPQRFFVDERKSGSGIRITESLSLLLESPQARNLTEEVESRWRLVETAWELGVNRSLLSIDYDVETERLFALDRCLRRKSVTGSRAALNGYQDGQCFYCSADIDLAPNATVIPDVDHFFPHVLKSQGFGAEIDGVWNLVLSCRSCNRGEGGKFARVPTLRLLAELHRRNEYLIHSHHPLRETLINQTGGVERQRQVFLNDYYQRAKRVLIHEWEPERR